MPVGCLGGVGSGGGGEASSNNGGHAKPMDVIITSSVLNASDQFAFMQQTLLMQIFRLSHTTPASSSSDGSSPSNNTSGNVSASISAATMPKCPTCIAFSDRCCQEDNGYRLFEEFIEANLHYCVWDQNSSDALNSLRYQGYICPGILVMIANSTHLELMADLWKRQLLTAPRGTHISQVGLSAGCVIRPVPVSHSISLHDVLCLILARLKQRGQVADMNTIIKAVNQDWSSLVSRMKLQEAELRDTVHSSLGALIKQRKVYYTGDKGYFLVGPASSDNTAINGGTSVTSGNNANQVGCAGGLFGGLNGQSNGHGGLSSVTGLGSRISQFRHSMKAGSSNGSPNSNSTSPDTSLQNRDSPPRSLEDQNRQGGNTSGGSTSTSPNSSFNLERSQSLRISKKSLRSLSSKGGSLRLSKKEAANALKQVKEADSECNETESMPYTPNLEVLTKTKSLPPGQPPMTNGSNPKSFERKNSFLSKLFSGASPSSKKSALSSGSGSGVSTGQNSKPILATFSAQFPPPELQLQDPNAIYQQLIPASQRPPQPPVPILRSPTDGLGGGYESSCESNLSGSGNASPQVKVNKGISNNNNQLRGGGGGQNGIYSMGSTYGYAPLRHYQPPQRTYEVGKNSVYSAPPPPLPYRPPPPNPYTTNLNNNLMPSPTNMRLSPSPTSISNSTPPPQAAPLPSSMAIYARVSNLKKVNNNAELQQPQNQHSISPRSSQNQNLTSPRPSPPSIPNTTQPPLAAPVPSSMAIYSRGGNLKKVNNNGGLQQPQNQPNISSSPVRNVRFADEQGSGNGPNSLASTSSSSGPSSIESVQRNNNSGLYDETLVVIEKSNKELEKKLSQASEPTISVTTPSQPSTSKQPPLLIRPRLVDTIHNNKNSLAQEIIYEVEPSSPQAQQRTTQKQNQPLNLASTSTSSNDLRTDVLLRSASQSQLKNPDTEGSSVAPSYPSLSDLSIADLSSFKSLTAQKLMAGLSFNSIDTLLEVNAAAEARSKLNESTETVDFGII